MNAMNIKIAMNDHIIKSGKNAGKTNNNKDFTLVNGNIDDITAIASAVCAYAISTTANVIPDAVSTFSRATWDASKTITSVKRLKSLPIMTACKFTSADIAYMASLMLTNDKTDAGKFKLVGKNTAIAIVMDCLYCKQEGIEYTCKARKTTVKTSHENTKKARENVEAKNTRACKRTKKSAPAPTENATT